MSSPRRTAVGACVALASACNVPIERFTRADAAAPADGAEPSDASQPAPFAPLHLPPEALMSGAPDLVLSVDPTIGNPIVIDTSALTVDGHASAYFIHVGNYAVLFVGELSVESAVTVTGTSPLIAVATGHITIVARVDLGAVGATLGPGAAEGNLGAGGTGQSTHIPPPADVQVSSGGGGGGYGTPGGGGGPGGGGRAASGTAGVTYGLQPGDPLVGGARGGAGGCIGSCSGGGGGGGALQLSSAISITVTASGVITAAGGRGRGGGGGPTGGSGGGAGGEILLEAPSIVVAGTLAANGGGGGGAGGNGGAAVPQGLDGEDGHDSATPASGGAGGIPMGSDGGAGAAGTAGAFSNARSGSAMNSEGGGGGGGAGRIWLRYRAATPPDRSSGTISPPAGLDDTL